MGKLSGKTAIITGATSGIGLEAARLFAREGANLVLSGRRKKVLEELVGEIKSAGGAAIAVPGDVTQESYVKELVANATATYGALHVAFNNAATLGSGGEISTIPLEGWNETLATNLTSAFLCAKYQIPVMLQQGFGSLIFTSSFVGASVGLPGMASYAASKAGLVGLTRVLASQYGSNGIRVNVLAPGGTVTPMSDSFIDSPETQKFVNSIHALKRMAQPAEIANAALFLASDDSSFVTGSILFADGGVSISKG